MIVPTIPFDKKARKPLYLQLYEGYRDAIVCRQLEPGQRLPSTRFLASELNVSRVSVVNAFEQLIAEGYFETRTGTGTFVATSLPKEVTSRGTRTVGHTFKLPGNSSAHSRLTNAAFGSWSPSPWDSKFRAFRVGLPSLESFPLKLWSKLVARQSRNSHPEFLGYGNPMGYLPLREAVADYLHIARGVKCDPDQIMIVNGSQHALHIAARVLIDAGNSVWLEEPGYPGAQMAFRLAGAKIVPVPVDEQGIIVSEGVKLSPRASAVYVTPGHHYPLGVSLSPGRRLELLNWAIRAGAWIIEDDYDSEYRYSSRPLASLQALDRDSRIILIGTFSKVMFPALRLGYLVLPKDLVNLFAACRESMDWSSPLLYQAVMTEFIVDGHFARHIRKMLLLYKSLRDTLVDVLRKDGTEEFSVLNADAGMHLVALLKNDTSDVTLAINAAKLGVSVTPLSKCFIQGSGPQGLILGYGNVEMSEIRTGVQMLLRAIHNSAANNRE